MLYFREGAEFTGKPLGDAKAPFTIVIPVCRRCGGAGRSDAWRHTGYVCYDCNGDGKGPARETRLYTAEQLAKMNATRDKARQRKLDKAAAAHAVEQAAVQARTSVFQDEHRTLLAWLETVALERDTEAREYREGFLGDMLRRADHSACWSEAQIKALHTSYQRDLERRRLRAGSIHVGTVGERLTTTVIVEREASYTRPAFGGGRWTSDGYRSDEDVFITTLRDADGNALIVKSPTLRFRVGETVTIVGTVKEHSEFNGEQQTTVQRVRVK